MKNVVQKVTAFITRTVNETKELLVFQHPTAGIQLPAGTVELGEDLEADLIIEPIIELIVDELQKASDKLDDALDG